MVFAEALKTNFLAIAQVFVLGMIGFYILKLGVLGQCCLRTISNLVVEIALPCFIFTNTLTYFPLVRGESWYVFPLYTLLIFTVAASLAFAYSKIDSRLGKTREFISLVTFQNSGFLPIILIGALAPKELQGKLFIYIFLFILLYNIVLFTFGETIFSGTHKKIGWKNLLNSASIATVAALVLSLAGGRQYIPDAIFKPLKMLGDTTIPLSMVVIGGIVMVNYAGKAKFPYGFVFKAGFLKLVALPLLVFVLLLKLNLPSEARFLIMIEALMPPAAVLPLMADKYDGDHNLVGQALFGITLMSLITVPVLMSLLNVTIG